MDKRVLHPIEIAMLHSFIDKGVPSITTDEQFWLSEVIQAPFDIEKELINRYPELSRASFVLKDKVTTGTVRVNGKFEDTMCVSVTWTGEYLVEELNLQTLKEVIEQRT